MYQFLRKFSLVAMLVLLSMPSYSEGVYGGAMMQLTTFENDLADKVNLGTALAKVGYQIDDNFAVEGRLGTGLGTDNVDDCTFTCEERGYQLNAIGGVYASWMPSIEADIKPYVALGVTSVKLEGKGDAADIDIKATDLSYGVGLKFNLDEQFDVSVEYMSYTDEDAAEVDGFSVGLTAKF